ncbi:hypothetical protein MAR_031330 [Mya arenaria]|uniref:Cysteine-rich membrane protein 2 n=1 Tax=Mya arenaria TaxID=6604 RepID=A0ABY7FBR9_MYAAR|nr:hypothetical protein MAR_031330 [Mya arenaria]
MDGLTGETCNDRCESICKTCSQTNPTHCTSCSGGFTGPGCNCIPNCRCELNGVCNECINGFILESQDCKCNKKFCVDSNFCPSCQNDTFYTFDENQCLNGCDDGYTGADCADLCTDYDNECTKCSQNEHFCVQCKGGLTPNTDATTTSTCDSSAAGIVGGTVGGASTIIILIIGIVLCIQRFVQYTVKDTVNKFDIVYVLYFFVYARF